METKRRAIFLLVSLLWGADVVCATDIVTLSGRRFYDVHDVIIRGNLLTFSTETEIVKIPLTDTSQELKERYAPKESPAPPAAPTPASNGPMAVGPGDKQPTTPHELVVSVANKCILQIAENIRALPTNGPLTVAPRDAFPVDRLDEARRDALINGRAVAFYVVDHAFFDQPADPTQPGALGAFAQFFATFKTTVTPVFVHPAQDLAKLPESVTIMLQKPASVAAPRVIFTNADTSKALHDMALPSEKATSAEREEAVVAAVVSIKRWYLDLANATH